MKRWSSLRRTDAPIPVALMAVLPLRRYPLAVDQLLRRTRPLAVVMRHGARAGRDSLHDIVVAGAAAEIAFELMADGLIVELVALAVHHVDGGHDHARRAIAALQAVMLAEGLLHGMQRSVGRREALDGGNIGAVDLPSKDRAGLDGLAVHMHHAG